MYHITSGTITEPQDPHQLFPFTVYLALELLGTKMPRHSESIVYKIPYNIIVHKY